MRQVGSALTGSEAGRDGGGHRAAGPVAVVGAGSIGVAWAVTFARAGCAVALVDPDAARLPTAAAEVADRIETLAQLELLEDSASVVVKRVRVTDDLRDAVRGVVHVQENAPERLEVKTELFRELDSAAPADAVLASSSSAITASLIAEDVPGRHRCLVVHPANPPFLIPVVEVVPAPFTLSTAIERTEQLLAAVGMIPVRVHREIEGFIYNRLQGALLREAYCLVRDGVADALDVDTVVREGLARRWSVVGPFATAELNTRGGLVAHAAVMGPAYERMGAERGQHDPWPPELVAAVAERIRSRLPNEQWSANVAWRDLELMRRERAYPTRSRGPQRTSAPE